jgi:hypothetical protein
VYIAAVLRAALRCLIVAAPLCLAGEALAQPPSREAVLVRIEGCRVLGGESDRLFCLWDVFEEHRAVAALEPDEAESFLLELGDGMDDRSEQECGSAGSLDSAEIASWAVQVWEQLIARYVGSCGEDPAASCSDDRVRQIHETMHRYVGSLLRRAAITRSSTDEVTYRLAEDFEAGYLDRGLLRLWERSICDCSRQDAPSCSGGSGAMCRAQAPGLCEDGPCGERWCYYGEKLAQFDGLPSSYNRLRTKLSSTARCGGAPEGGP